MTLKSNPSEVIFKGDYKMEKISASGSKSWLTCGLQWRLSHIDKLELVRLNSNLAYGSAVHKGAEPIWRGQNLTGFAKVWKPYKDKDIDYGKGQDDWSKLKVKGEVMLKKLYETVTGTFDPAASRVEVHENIDLGFVVLDRRIDVVTVAKKMPVYMTDVNKIENVSGVVNLDLKTSRSQYSDIDVMGSQQLLTYAIPNGKSKKLNASVYVVVTKSSNPVIQLIGKRYEKWEVVRQVNRLRFVTDQIRRGVFIQNEDKHCGWCDFKALCYRLPGWQKMYRLRRDRSGPVAVDTVTDIEE